MTTFDRVKELIPAMTSQEKLSLIDLLAHDLGGAVLGIERTPGICGGSARIAGTRIPVWAIVNYTQLGLSKAELLLAYPTITADDLANALAYFQAHDHEIIAEIQENETA